jgi:FkbM family methyltransferase
VPENILHCGAYLGEENETYLESGVGKIHWLEAIPELCDSLEEKFGSEYVHRYALTSSSNQYVSFYIAENVLSSSTKVFRAENEWNLAHKSEIVVKTICLADLLCLIPEHIDLLILDLQGGELDALTGPMMPYLPKMMLIEVSDFPFYQNGPTTKEISTLMSVLGYQPVVKQVRGIHGHGDVLFLYQPTLHQKLRIIQGKTLLMLIRLSQKLRHFFN